MTDAPLFIKELDDVIRRHSMLDHPFYQTWTMGRLSREALKDYAKQYYHFVQAFPTFLSAAHSNTPDLSVRQELLENLIEEERGKGNHPGLWLKFTESLGVQAADAAATPMLPETREAIGAFRTVTREGTYLEGIAALYAYESQIPEVARVKIEGLRKFYGITTKEGLEFFTVHQEADVAHSAGEKSILLRHATGAADREQCLAAATTSAQAMLRLLDGVYESSVRPSLH